MEIAKTIAPVCLAIIMFGLGLGLTTSDFTRVLKTPRDFFVGFLSQAILLPIIAFGLIIIIPMPIEIAMGVMIIAAAPGGVTSNVLTKFANGDVALSVSLTAIVSLLTIFMVPLIVFNSANFLGVETTKEISMASISVKMFFVVTVPVILRMIIRKFANEFINRNVKNIQRVSIVLFLLIFIAIYIEEWDKIVMFLTSAGKVAFALNILMMIIGFYVAKFLASGIAQRRCISLECGLQNGTLAVFVGTQLFGTNMTYMVPTAAYALIMMTTSLIFVLILKRQT